ncbi:Uncharacterised protein [Pseudescherichia vulneris]|nr:Uncharacterised protein [Pseudescherichia vulneris]
MRAVTLKEQIVFRRLGHGIQYIAKACTARLFDTETNAA